MPSNNADHLPKIAGGATVDKLGQKTFSGAPARDARIQVNRVLDRKAVGMPGTERGCIGKTDHRALGLCYQVG